MRLYLIRHSVPEPLPSGEDDYDADDSDVDLTSEGEEIARAVGKWIADSGDIPSRIIASATTRTQRTAELIAKELGEAGYAAPDIETDVGIGPQQSIRGLVKMLAADKKQNGVAIVSHHESIVAGLKALRVDNDKSPEVDKPAMGELRTITVKRGSGKWKEKGRVRPSDLDLADYY